MCHLYVSHLDQGACQNIGGRDHWEPEELVSGGVTSWTPWPPRWESDLLSLARPHFLKSPLHPQPPQDTVRNKFGVTKEGAPF